MIRLLCVVVLSAALLVSMAAEETEIKLSEDIQEELAEYKAEIAEIIAEAKAEVADEKKELIEDLEKELKKATKKGDLEGATAIQERVAELKQEKNESNGGLFGIEQEKKEQPPKVEVKILRSFIATGDGGMKNVAEDLQKIVDRGEIKFVPAKAFGEAYAKDHPRRLLMEYQIDGKTYRKACAWESELDLTAP